MAPLLYVSLASCHESPPQKKEDRRQYRMRNNIRTFKNSVGLQAMCLRMCTYSQSRCVSGFVCRCHLNLDVSSQTWRTLGQIWIDQTVRGEGAASCVHTTVYSVVIGANDARQKSKSLGARPARLCKLLWNRMECVFIITDKAKDKGGGRQKVSVLWKTKS
jgi:hypothetical protein